MDGRKILEKEKEKIPQNKKIDKVVAFILINIIIYSISLSKHSNNNYRFSSFFYIF